MVVTQALTTLGGAVGEGLDPGRNENTSVSVEWPAALSSPHPTNAVNDRVKALLALCGVGDEALTNVAGLVAARQKSTGNNLSADELTFVLRAQGDPHVWPKAWSLSGDGLEDQEIVDRFKTWIAGFHTLGTRRCGASRTDDGATVVTFDALADLSPVPTQARAGQWITLEGTMLVPASGVQVVVLGPHAAPRTVPSSLSGNHIRATFSVDQQGEWLVQVLATISTGPRPVLESTIFVGQKPPSTFVRAKVPGEEAAVGAKDSADAMLRMMNAARASEGLGKLTRTKELDKLALEHSEEMMKTRIVGHDVGSGDPRARLDAAGLTPKIAGENVASAGSLENAHRVLWASPSHRGNLLHPRFGHAGVAVTKAPDGSFWVTELFTD